MANVAIDGANLVPDAVADAAQLKRRLKSAERLGKMRALLLIAPLFLFILASFVLPIAVMLRNAVYDPDVGNLLPQTIKALEAWDGKDVPDEPVFAALVADLAAAEANRQSSMLGKRLNYELSGIRSQVLATSRKAASMQPPFKEQVIATAKVWGERNTWAVIKRSGPPLTDFYLLKAVDLERNADNEIVRANPNQAIYLQILGRTMYISVLVTLLTLVLGFPVAYVLANVSPRIGNLLMILVLLPFWTSLLVRTTAWFVLLQDNGLINETLQTITGATEPYALIFSRFGTVIAMTHIQLPFTLLPIYSVMKGISPSYMRAARSLGGGPVYSFVKVYLPQTLPGIGAGCLLTFILCLGYYITPALVGGPTDQMVSGFIERSINAEGNWGKACALGTILLVATLILYWVYNKIVGIDKVKLG
jgi:putative spermidine/putrescine transport system permease protein